MTEPKWEYLTEFNYGKLVTIKCLESFLKDGWELISVIDVRHIEAANWQLFFKRPILPPPQSTN